MKVHEGSLSSDLQGSRSRRIFGPSWSASGSEPQQKRRRRALPSPGYSTAQGRGSNPSGKRG